MLEIHFLNVGHGDCTIIRHPSGRLTMLDINNGQVLDPVSQAEEEQELLLGAPSNGLFRPAGAVGVTCALPPNALLGLAGTASVASEPWAAYPSPVGAALAAAGRPTVRREDLVDPLAYLDGYFPGQAVHRYIQTHPDLDHMRGLARLMGQRRVLNFWHPGDTKPTPRFTSDEDRADWNEQRGVRQGKYNNVTVLSPEPGQVGAFWWQEQGTSLDGDGIQVLSPTRQFASQCNRSGKSNDISFVLAVHYAGRRIILGGDAEQDAWQDMVHRYGSGLSCTVLKASHHGRDSGFDANAVRLMKPRQVVLSVGKKPETDAHRRYRDLGAEVLSTRKHGTLVLRVWPDGLHHLGPR